MGGLGHGFGHGLGQIPKPRTRLNNSIIRKMLILIAPGRDEIVEDSIFHFSSSDFMSCRESCRAFPSSYEIKIKN